MLVPEHSACGRLWAVIAGLLCALLPQIGAAADVPIVAAASDLKFALEEAAAAFTRTTGRSVRLVFGSSGNFRSQIAAGAPIELFLSADEDLVTALQHEGRTAGGGRLYAIGRLALMIPRGSPLKVDPGLGNLRVALTDGRLQKFAIANPDHAPYGKRAKEALQHAGLWGAIQPFLVLGENVAQAAAYATSGSAQGGLIAWSLARSPGIGRLGEAVLIPAGWHSPLRQRMVLIKGAGSTAEAFYAFLTQPEARAIFERYGFTLPSDAD